MLNHEATLITWIEIDTVFSSSIHQTFFFCVIAEILNMAVGPNRNAASLPFFVASAQLQSLGISLCLTCKTQRLK